MVRAVRLFAVAGVAALALMFPTRAQSPAPVAMLAEWDGIVHPVTVGYIKAAVQRADAANAAVLILTLRTPGGLVDSTRDINSAIIGAKTPVVVFVGPSGSRAASAGFLITMAADVAAMAPGTHIGAAHPVSGGGEKVDDTMEKKMVSDVASYARTLATARKRNVELVEKAVTESRSFTEREALDASPPLIDLVASDVQDVLRQLDGRSVLRFDGRTAILRTAGAATERVELTWAQRFLSTLAHPQIAYLLLTLGTLGLTIELWNPGSIFPGVAGGICLLMAFFAFQVLPISYAGLALIVFGIALLILEIKVTSYGLLGVGGVVSLFLGSLMLIDSPLPELQVGLRMAAPMSIAMSAILLFLVRLGVQSQRLQTVTGEAGMLGETGRALTALGPGGKGRIQTRGEIWTATASEPISAGDAVRVIGVRGLVLTVERAAASAVAAPAR